MSICKKNPQAFHARGLCESGAPRADSMRLQIVEFDDQIFSEFSVRADFLVEKDSEVASCTNKTVKLMV